MLRLAADNLGKRFGRRVLFRRLSFRLEGGQSLAVTGANGSGKSTLLRILAGVLAPSAGEVWLSVRAGDVPPEARPLHAGLVAPYLNVYDDFSARENLAFLARARRLPGTEERIGAALAIVGLTARADDRVRTFSSGMKQRVKYAAALLAEPSLLLLDEPAANLDAEGLAMVERVIGHQRAGGGLLVVATNDPAEAARLDRVIRIEDFR